MLILIDEADIIAFVYVCKLEVTSSRSKFLHLFNSCYHMVIRSSEVSLSIFNDIKMENFQDNSRYYNAAIKRIDRANTSTYQELCIYPERELILYDW